MYTQAHISIILNAQDENTSKCDSYTHFNFLTY